MEERTKRCLTDAEVTAPPLAVAAVEAHPEGGPCAARAAFDRVGDRWSMLVLYHLTEGTLRFNALQRRIGGISQRVLASTLRSLERDGLVLRTQYPTIPPQVEYEPTPLGRSLLRAVTPLVGWFEAHEGRIADHRAGFDARRQPAVES